jgi:hypothetical protein
MLFRTGRSLVSELGSSSSRLGALLYSELGISSSSSSSASGAPVLLVTDPGVRAAGLCDGALRSLEEAGFIPYIFDQCAPDPPEVSNSLYIYIYILYIYILSLSLLECCGTTSHPFPHPSSSSSSRYSHACSPRATPP